jgi:tetratricopeptide (TPR) repeat protein
MYFAPDRKNLEEAQKATLKAILIHSEYAEANASRGLSISLSGNYVEAMREFDTAILLDAQLFEAYYFYARTCFAQGLIDRASELFQQASLVNPSDYQSAILLGFAYRAGGKTELAKRAYQRGIEKVEKHLEFNPDDSRAYYLGAEALYELDQKGKADQFADQALAIASEDPYIVYGMACYYSKTGRTEQALQHCRNAVSGGFTHRDWIENDADLDPIRDHQEFQDVLRLLSD